MSKSKHVWIAELQDRDGKVVEYHSLELEEHHYASRAEANRAFTSWSAFRQRERKNLKCNRSPRSRVQWACDWLTPDSITFFDGVPEMPLHKTIWDLYKAIGYDYKTKRYERDTMTEEKRMRGDNPHVVHIDESGFINKDGQQLYVASGNGKHEWVVEVDGVIVPTDEVKLPAHLKAMSDAGGFNLDKLLAEQAACKHGKETAQGDMCWDCDDERAALKHAAEAPDEKAVAARAALDSRAQAYTSEQEKLDDAARIMSLVKMPGDRRNDPRVIAHKRGVVKAHQKIKRQQAKKERLKALRLSAFNGK